MKLYWILVVLILSCGGNKSTNPHVLIETPAGDIEVELYPLKAPATVAAFMKNVDDGVYENGTFYRVLKGEELPTDFNTGILQGGIYKKEKHINVPGIPHESTQRTGLKHEDGTISMARTSAGTASTEFFICIGDQLSYDSGGNGTADKLGMAAFGKVTSGMKVARKIQNEQNNGDALKNPIIINNIKRL